MITDELIAELCSYNFEKEWFEFKENWFEPTELGEYISVLSNSAACLGKSVAYFVWEIDDQTHEIVGSGFASDCNVKNEPLKLFLARQLSPDIDFTVRERNRQQILS